MDPAAFLRQHKDRVKLLHLKDRLPGFPTSYTTDAGSDHSTELGKGNDCVACASETSPCNKASITLFWTTTNHRSRYLIA